MGGRSALSRQDLATGWDQEGNTATAMRRPNSADSSPTSAPNRLSSGTLTVLRMRAALVCVAWMNRIARLCYVLSRPEEPFHKDLGEHPGLACEAAPEDVHVAADGVPLRLRVEESNFTRLRQD